MEDYLNTALNAYRGFWQYLIYDVSHPGLQSAFWRLMILSLGVWLLEIVFPWRKAQGAFRKDFWLDAFYIIFNSFLFPLLLFAALSGVAEAIFRNNLSALGLFIKPLIDVKDWPNWLQLLTLFLLADFIQWNVHRLLHRVPWMWQFHKIHHSVKAMGFAAHLRFHPMELVFYSTLQYLPLALISFKISDVFLLQIFTLLIGHLNHANLPLNYGPLKYVLNNPAMHIWHHAHQQPERFGINFGITLSLWDYLFGTAYIPQSGRDEALGFTGDENFPTDFWGQLVYPFRKA